MQEIHWGTFTYFVLVISMDGSCACRSKWTLWREQDAITGSSILAICTHRLTFLCLLPEVKMGFSFGDLGPGEAKRPQGECQSPASSREYPRSVPLLFLLRSTCGGVSSDCSTRSRMTLKECYFMATSSWVPFSILPSIYRIENFSSYSVPEFQTSKQCRLLHGPLEICFWSHDLQSYRLNPDKASLAIQVFCEES